MCDASKQGGCSMTEFADPMVFWSMVALQFVGLASILLARFPHACIKQGYCRGLFVLCLMVLGFATIYSIGAESSYWAWCGTTFSVMAVGGTSDLGGSVQGTGF